MYKGSPRSPAFGGIHPCPQDEIFCNIRVHAIKKWEQRGLAFASPRFSLWRLLQTMRLNPHPLNSFGIGANSRSSGQNLFFGPQEMIPFRQSSDRHSYFRTTFSAAVCSGSNWTT